MNIKIFEPISYCSGVENAINSVIKYSHELSKKYKNFYMLGKIVNNDRVTAILEAFGIKTIDVTPDKYLENLMKLTKKDVVFFSAHGHDKSLDKYCESHNIIYRSVTCPIILNNEKKIKEVTSSKNNVIFIGIDNHPETISFLSLYKNIYLYNIETDGFPLNLKGNIFIISQTTLSDFQVKKAYANIEKVYKNCDYIDGLCPNTVLRQKNLLSTPAEYDLIVIVGSKSSSNTRRLFELAQSLNRKSTLLVNSISDLRFALVDIAKCKNAAIYSGTSTPLEIVGEIAEYLEKI